MTRTFALLAASILTSGIATRTHAQVAAPPSAAEVTLTRLDCGNAAAPSEAARFSDTYAYTDFKVLLTYSCYLIRHGNDYMLWDAGNPTSAPIVRVSMLDQLATLKIAPASIKFLGISHYHGDHTGQAASFPQATLLIGKADWDVLTAPTPVQGINAAPFAPWITGGGKLELQAGDKKDVFGDGTVVMIRTPGHTPGHHSLLVRLRTTGNVLISGDLTHFRENYDNNGVPTNNTNRADTMASLDRFRSIAKNLNAVVIIQHDARDIAKLPAFPAAAR